MSDLRFLADAYEQSQRLRIETGERIRAVLQGRDTTWQDVPAPFRHAHKAAKKARGEPKCARCDAILERIKRGETPGPVAILGTTCRHHWEVERACFDEMGAALTAHPAWPWLQRVKGVGDTLACKLLARLDATKADTPSAFWAYCGLATIPGFVWRCETCGLERAWPAAYAVTGKHQALGSTRNCSGALVKVGEGRCAQPRPARGEKAAYDQYAKKVCYLIGMQFVKIPGCFYERVYRRAKAQVAREHPGWADGRVHLTALRKTEKLFLSHLWLVWREALGLPVTQPYAQAQGHDGYVGPWEAVGEGSRPAGGTRKKGASRQSRATRAR